MRDLRERIREVDDRVWDRAIAAGMSALMVAFVLGAPDLDGSVALNLLVGLTMTGSLLLRRDHPVVTAFVVAGCGVVLLAFLTSPPELAPAVFTLMIASYSSGVHADRPATFAGLALTAGMVAVVSAIDTPEDILFPFFIFGVAPWAIGRALRGQTELVRELAEKEARVEHLREEQAASAIASERTRVARDLHDVLAHNLSVMVIQASGARRAVKADPSAALASAELIENTGRETLAELRNLFGTVRRGEVEGLDGSPGMAQLEGLIGRARRAGLPATLQVRGEPVALGTGADMAAYRLVQEALTNTLKHAGSATTEVRVGYRMGDVVIDVVNDGDGYVPPDAAVDSGGHGLVGMKERVGLYGGEMWAGPRDEGGFAVHARLPLGKIEAGR